MTVRAREEHTIRGAPSKRRRVFLREEEQGVSPVVGMILVLGISIVGIASILYWGLPAIDEMKANVEYKSVEAQFLELDSTVKELVTGTTEKTAKRWHPSLNRGSIVVRDDTESWLFATDNYHATKHYDFVWTGFVDGDNQFRVFTNEGITQGVRVEAYRLTGSSTQTALNLSLHADNMTPVGLRFGDQMNANAFPSWTNNTAVTFYLFEPNNRELPIPIKNQTLKFRILVNNELVAEAWYMTTGRIDYDLAAGLGSKKIVSNGGGVFGGSAGRVTMVNTPPLPPPTTTNEVPRFFARTITYNGNASFAGEHRFDMLVSLNSTSTLASYDCALGTRTDCVENVKLFIFGDYRDTWYRYLQNENRGYAFTENSWEGTSYLVDKRDHMGFTLLKSSIQLGG